MVMTQIGPVGTEIGWLICLSSELPTLLGKKPVRNHLVHALVEIDREFTKNNVEGKWEDYYAKRLVELENL